ncbi:MAG: cyclase family protein [Candidatus Krumholzibacteria bacterium]|nr:cyclase family protein [Candidatus Krumholzibacteria bacterium]
MKLMDLTHTIKPGMPQWPDDRQPLDIHRHSLHGPDAHMSSSLEIGCHVGTHIDVPLHFLAGEPGVDRLPVDGFVGKGVVIRAGKGESPGALGPEVCDGVDLTSVDFVLFDTGWGKHWGTDRYYRDWSFLSPELAELLAGAGLKGVGLDTPSLDPFDGQVAHDICAPAGMINIENLANLAALPEEGFTLLVLPLKLEGTEASPVRAVAIVPDCSEVE